uniref:Uncharacterized protein n=1 Tax=Arundo donax TaxID=35708 RepID=A0A0A9C4E9_ARUDO
MTRGNGPPLIAQSTYTTNPRRGSSSEPSVGVLLR